MTTSPNLKFLFQHPAHFIALGFGSGLAKKAPGTFGTLVAFPLYFLMPKTLVLGLVVLVAMFLLGCYVCETTGKNLGVPDHGSIVWDEIVAMMLVLALTPPNWFWWLLAFGLFRLFDIWKPFPIRQFDAKLKNGFGVMFDDLLAAIFAIVSLKLILWTLSQIPILQI